MLTSKSDRARLLKAQHALDITACSNQSPLGRVVTRLMMNTCAAVSPEELSKLKAEDANFLERFMKQPRVALLIGRYAWAPFAAETYLSYLEAKNKPSDENHKVKTMDAKTQASPVSQLGTQINGDLAADLTQVIYQEIGTAVGSIVFADGILNFSEVRAKLRSERTSLHMVACPQKAYEAVKAFATSFCGKGDHDGDLPLPKGVTVSPVPLSSDQSNTAFDGGQLYSLRIEGDTPGNSIAKTIYFISGIKGRTERRAAPHNPGIRGVQLRGGAAMDTSTYHADQARERNKAARNPMPPSAPPKHDGRSGHSTMTSDCRTERTSAKHPAKPSGVTLRDSIPARVREDMAKREWPAFEEPERDTGRPRKKAGGKKQKGGGSRTERRLK